MLIQSVIDTYTYLALKIHLVFAFFAVYSGIDSHTLIHIFKPIHTHYTQRYASTSIYLYADCWYSFTLKFRSQGVGPGSGGRYRHGYSWAKIWENYVSKFLFFVCSLIQSCLFNPSKISSIRKSCANVS